jgi:hypothetical protein
MENKSTEKELRRLVTAVSVAVLIMLSKYLSARLHDWCGLSNPLSMSFGTLIAFAVVLLGFGSGRLTKKAFILLAISVSLVEYILGRAFHL